MDTSSQYHRETAAEADQTEEFDTAEQARLFVMIDAEKIIEDAESDMTDESAEAEVRTDVWASVMEEESEKVIEARRAIRRMLAKEAQITDVLGELCELETVVPLSEESARRLRWEIGRRKSALFIYVRSYNEHLSEAQHRLKDIEK